MQHGWLGIEEGTWCLWIEEGKWRRLAKSMCMLHISCCRDDISSCLAGFISHSAGFICHCASFICHCAGFIPHHVEFIHHVAYLVWHGLGFQIVCQFCDCLSILSPIRAHFRLILLHVERMGTDHLPFFFPWKFFSPLFLFSFFFKFLFPHFYIPCPPHAIHCHFGRRIRAHFRFCLGLGRLNLKFWWKIKKFCRISRPNLKFWWKKRNLARIRMTLAEWEGARGGSEAKDPPLAARPLALEPCWICQAFCFDWSPCCFDCCFKWYPCCFDQASSLYIMTLVSSHRWHVRKCRDPCAMPHIWMSHSSESQQCMPDSVVTYVRCQGYMPCIRRGVCIVYRPYRLNESCPTGIAHV